MKRESKKIIQKVEGTRMYRDEIWIAFYDNRGTLSHQVLRWKKKKKRREEVGR